jgi:hypothetical protein
MFKKSKTGNEKLNAYIFFAAAADWLLGTSCTLTKADDGDRSAVDSNIADDVSNDWDQPEQPSHLVILFDLEWNFLV